MFPATSPFRTMSPFRISLCAAALLLLAAAGHAQTTPQRPNADAERLERLMREKEAEQARARQAQESRLKQEFEFRARQEEALRQQREHEMRAKQEFDMRARQEEATRLQREQETRARQDLEARARQEEALRQRRELETREGDERASRERQEREQREHEARERWDGERRLREGRGSGVAIAPPIVDYAPAPACAGGEIELRGDCPEQSFYVICYGAEPTAAWAGFALQPGETRIVTTPPGSTYTQQCRTPPAAICPARNCVNAGER